MRESATKRVMTNDMAATVAFEFKTLSSPTKIDALNKVLAELDLEGKRVIRCQFGDETCKKVVSQEGYGFQVLQQGAVLELGCVLVCVATSTFIECCLLVDVLSIRRDPYESILTDFAENHLQCIYGDEPFPNVTEANISSGKYKVEAETVQLNSKL